jgi:hypothetical protein
MNHFFSNLILPGIKVLVASSIAVLLILATSTILLATSTRCCCQELSQTFLAFDGILSECTNSSRRWGNENKYT